MSLRKGLCWSLMVGVCFTSAAPAANIVLNPGFETGDLAPWMTNGEWDVIGGTGGIFPNTGNFFANTGCVGTPCIAPDSSVTPGAAWLYQDLVTVPGTTYTVSFAYASGLGSSEITSQALTGVELQVLWGPSSIPLTSSAPGTCLGTTNCVFDTTDTSNGEAYAIYTLTNLLATSSLTRLEFLGEQTPAQNGLDDVSVNASAASSVPEPGTFFLIGGGLLALAATLRLRSRRQ